MRDRVRVWVWFRAQAGVKSRSRAMNNFKERGTL